MEITPEDRVRMERAHVRAWPALRTAAVEGWLWRSSGGGSQRANSVSTIDFTGNDLAGAIDRVEAAYRAVGEPARFQTFDETSPAGLADALRVRGYREGEATVTMFRRLGAVAQAPDAVCKDHAWDEWIEVYLTGLTANRRQTNQRILSHIPRPCGFLGYRNGGRLVSTALVVIGFGCAVIECVATVPDARRRGGARTVVRAALRWAGGQGADLAGLQVAAGNSAATRLYLDLGFSVRATNAFWVSPPLA